MLLRLRPKCVGFLLRSTLSKCTPRNLHGLALRERGFGVKTTSRPQMRQSSSHTSSLVPAPPRVRRWAQWEIEALKSMKERKISVKQIAAELRRTVCSVKNRWGEVGQITAPRKKWSQAEVDALFRMQQNGIDIENICRELGRTQTAVRMRLYKPHLNFEPRIWTQGELDKLTKM